MLNRKWKKTVFLNITLCIICSACVKDTTFNTPATICIENSIANTTFSEVKRMYVEEVLQIQKELIIEGYVISSDKAGNFFRTLHIQEKIEAPTEGLQIEIDSRNTHLLYPIGSKVYIKLKGLYLGKSNTTYKLGGAFSTFGNLVVGSLPALKVREHILVACDSVFSIKPNVVRLDELEDSMLNTKVKFEEVEFIEDELGTSFATLKEATEKTVKDCLGNNIKVLNSGFSDFQAVLLPEGKGEIVGVLLKNKKEFQLVIRNLEDIRFSGERCPEIIEEFTSTEVFISELADPNNNTGARFIELYNAAVEPLSLKGWTLRRYTNANTEVSSSIDLTGYVIPAKSTFVITPNSTEFEAVYGFLPNLSVSTNSAADSNGDDTIVLVDPFEETIDIFGVIGEDGTNTNHEFEDGRALRKSTITKSNAKYTFREWVIYNDTGASGTINMPQDAPANFTPGKLD